MARAKRTGARKTPVKKVTGPIASSEEISVDIQHFLTPGAILISGLMIAFSIFFSFRGADLGGLRSGATNNGVTNAGLEGERDAAVPGGSGDETGKTSIDDDPVLGDKNSAKIAIVEFSDFECPFCQRFHADTYDQILSEYVDTGKAIFVYRDFPLSFHDPQASKAANAANCVRDQVGDEGYYKFVQGYFKATQANGQGLPSSTSLEKLAKNAGAGKTAEFNKCVDENRFADEVAKDLADGSASGITGTPGFIIGVLDDSGNVDGVIIPGAQPFASFQSIIETQLAR